ncbi:MAG: MmgE/PrpD family protein [Gammaproteobacteria bacterium]|nr:MmgE/PrpD family protein [Gammaproteobacteria bacterium]
MSRATDVTRRIARWTAESAPVRSDLGLRRAVDAIQDTVACMVAGAGDEGSYSVRRTVAGYGEGPVTVVGARRGAIAPLAALANGTSAHALDFDDNYMPALTHASAVLVPALLALAEQHDRSGAALVDAYITGLEVHAAVGRGIGRRQYDLGWHSTSTIGCIGTAAACARLLGLDADTTTHAISLAVSHASGAKVQFGSPGKPFHAGMAAHNAVLSATLAEQGLTARPDAIEGERGFADLYAGDPEADWTPILDTLGQTPAIEAYGLAPKLYPCCGSAHRVLDSVLALRAEHGFDAGQVETVEALVGYGNKRNLCYDEPTQEMEARFSLNYCVAVALLYGRVSLADFTPSAVGRPEVRALLHRTIMNATPAGAEGNDPTSRLPHEVRIRLKDGRVLESETLWARGTIHNPFAREDLNAKFADCCAGILGDEDYDAALRGCQDILALSSVRELTRHLRFDAGSDRGERFVARHQRGAAD